MYALIVTIFSLTSLIICIREPLSGKPQGQILGAFFPLKYGSHFFEGGYLVSFYCIQVIVNDTLQRFWLGDLPLKV